MEHSIGETFSPSEETRQELQDILSGLVQRQQKAREIMAQLPSIEDVSAAVHEAWMNSKRSAGVHSRKSENGEELMVPYAHLSEAAKDLDRVTVRTVYASIGKALGLPHQV